MKDGSTVRGITKPQRLIGASCTRADMCQNGTIVMGLLKRNMIIRLYEKSKNGKKLDIQPLLLEQNHNLPLCPGKFFTNETLNITMNERLRFIINPFMLSSTSLNEPYKNDPITANPWASFIIRWSEFIFQEGYPEKDQRRMRKWKTEHGKLPRIHGSLSGGSARRAGAVSFSPFTSKPCDSHVEIGKHQTLISPEGSAFSEILEEGLVVTLAVHKKYLEEERIANFNGYDFTPLKKHSRNNKKEEQNDDSTRATFLCQEGEMTGQDVLVLGHFKVTQLKHQKLTKIQDIKKFFEHIPGYLKNQTDNISYLVHGYWQIELKSVMDFETLLDLSLKWRKKEVKAYAEDKAVADYEYIDIHGAEEAKLVVQAKDIHKYLLEKELKQEDINFVEEHFGESTFYPEPLITREHVANYIIWQEEMEDILEMFNPSRSKEAMNTLYSVSAREVVIVMAVLMAAASLRADWYLSLGNTNLATCDEVTTDIEVEDIPEPKQKRTKTDVEGGEVGKELKSKPLLMKGSDYLPDPIRIRPIPCSNSDYDIARSAVRSNITF